MYNPLKYFRNRKVGLALGSGGSKGLAHISVIEYLLTHGIPIDYIAGSSIGAVVGAVYNTGRLEEFKDDLIQITRRELISLFDPIFPTNGLLNGKGFYDFLKRYIPEDLNIEDLETPLNILATDFNTGQSVVFKKGNILEALRASIAIPGILVPVKYKSTYLMDGGVANPLPVNIVKKMGAGITIAVNLHPGVTKKRWKSYVKSQVKKQGLIIDSDDIQIIEENNNKKPMPLKKSAPGYFNFIGKWPAIMLKNKNNDMKIPNIFEIISQTIDIMEYTNTRLMLKYNSPSVLIEPDVLDYGNLDFTEIPQIIKEGFEACYRVKGAITRNVKLWI